MICEGNKRKHKLVLLVHPEGFHNCDEDFRSNRSQASSDDELKVIIRKRLKNDHDDNDDWNRVFLMLHNQVRQYPKITLIMMIILRVI